MRKRYLWAYQFIRALIIYRYLFEYCRQIRETQQVTDESGNLIEAYTYSTYGSPVFGYDNTSPVIQNVYTTDGIVIGWFSEPVKSDTAESSFKVKSAGTELSGTLTQSADGRELRFTPSTSLPVGLLSVEVSNTVEDAAGNKIANALSETFNNTGADMMVYDSSAPEVEMIAKELSEFIFTFSERINPSTVNNSIELQRGDSTISITITDVDERTLKITPAETLESDKEYTIKVHPTLKDLSGKSIEEFLHSFMVLEGNHLIYEKEDVNRHTTSKIGNTYLFHGRDYEPEIGLYYYRNRYFLPRMGMFLQPDPMGYSDSMNMYQAFNMNPVNFVDPFGNTVYPSDYKALRVMIKGPGGVAYAKKWVADSPWFTYGEKVSLTLSILFGIEDPDEFSVAKYTFDKTTYQLYGWFWAKLQRGVLNKEYMGGVNDAAAGGINYLNRIFFSLLKLMNPDFAYEEDLNRSEKATISTVNKTFNANPETAMYATGEFYTPVIVGAVVGGELSAGMQSQFVDDILPFLDDAATASGSKVFYTVQSSDDAVRLSNGGNPWPNTDNRAALGEGVYAWESQEEALAYLQRINNRVPDAKIVKFSIPNQELAKLKSIKVDSLAYPEVWMSKYSRLWGGIPNHGYEYIIRGTAMGNEHFFHYSVYNLLRFL